MIAGLLTLLIVGWLLWLAWSVWHGDDVEARCVECERTFAWREWSELDYSPESLGFVCPDCGGKVVDVQPWDDFNKC